MAKEKTTIHPNVLAQTLRYQMGISELTKMYNGFKALRGTTPTQRKPVQPQSVNRYCNGGQGYLTSPPALFRQFCLSRVAKKFK